MRKSGNKAIPILLFFSLLAGIAGCANQKPPGGGEEDKTPPELQFQEPKGNSLNFRKKSLILEFSEYVDKRSFQEAFHLSPPYQGEVSFDWSGKEVEIIFDKPLWKTDPAKTFVVTINSTLTDIRGNKLASPISFAFSTGPKIDMAGISGRVYNNNESRLTMLAYRIGTDETQFDPTKILADYVTETSAEGDYKFTNLSPGSYRLIAINDEDRNLFYTAERESFGVLPDDISLEDSTILSRVDFFLKSIGNGQIADQEVNLVDFYSDSLGIVHSSVENNSRGFLPDQSIFIFFNKHRPAREDFVNSFSLKDESGKSEKVAYNWMNDSLVEVISAERLAYNRDYTAEFDVLISADSVYKFKLEFRTVSSNSFGEVNGTIKRPLEAGIESAPVYIELSSLEIKPVIKYSFTVSDTVFNLENIFEADYSVFSFVDKNFNGNYDYGSPYPLEHSEQFFVYPAGISVKGGWSIENVIINFIR